MRIWRLGQSQLHPKGGTPARKVGKTNRSAERFENRLANGKSHTQSFTLSGKEGQKEFCFERVRNSWSFVFHKQQAEAVLHLCFDSQDFALSRHLAHRSHRVVYQIEQYLLKRHFVPLHWYDTGGKHRSKLHSM